MSMVDLTLLAKLNRIICAAKHVDPQVPFGGVNVIFLVAICSIDLFMMHHCTLIFHYPPERNRVNYLRKKKFNNVLPVPLFFKSTVSSNLLKRCERKTCSICSFWNDFVVENATTATMNCCKLEWLVNQWLALYARLPGTRWAFSLYRTIFNCLFIQAPILVFRNEVRTHLDHKTAIHKAKQLGCAPTVCVAQERADSSKALYSSEKC